jgi:multidrug resistance efflux pump
MHTFWRLTGWGLWLLSRPAVWPWRLTRRLTGSFRFWLLVLVLVLVVVVAYHALADRATPFTTDAYVQAYVIQMAPQVGGRVVRVYAAEGEEVRAGQLLFELDGRRFENAVALAEAQLAEARQKVKQLDAELAAARAEESRLKAETDLARVIHEQEQKIFQKEATTQRRYLEARDRYRASQAALEKSAQMVRHAEQALAARVGREHALVAQAKARLSSAQLELAYCRVHAPCDGVITDLQLRDGAYIHAGQAALTVIDTSRWHIVAHFRERSLEVLREGQPALVALQGAPGKLYRARVTTTGWGVGQGQGKPSGLLPDVKRQTSWVQPSQRFPVRLVLEDAESASLRVGLTGSVSVYVEEEGLLVDITRGVHQLLAWLYYL